MIEWEPRTADEFLSDMKSHIRHLMDRPMPNALPLLILGVNEYETLKKYLTERKRRNWKVEIL